MTDLQAASRDFMAAAQNLSTLVEIETEAMLVWSLLHQVDDDLWTPEERADLEQRLEAASTQLLSKLESYAGLIRKLETLADNDDAELDRIKRRRDRKRRSAEWLKGRLLEHLKRTNQERIETARFTISVRKNPPSVKFEVEPQEVRVDGYVDPPADVPQEFVTIVTAYKVDKRAILSRVKDTGEVVPGCHVQRTERVQIT